jgi:hypothetical protein
MTIHNISADADASLINGLPSGVDNDQGTIRGGGNVASTAKFSADALTLGPSRQVTVVSGVGGNTGILAAGAFNGGDYVIRTVTSDLAGVSNTVLREGSNSANRGVSINQVAAVTQYLYKTAVRTGGWHELSGVFSPAVSTANTGVWDISTTGDVSANVDGSGTDNAANPTQNIPGELVYRDGSPTPVQDDYQAKTSF